MRITAIRLDRLRVPLDPPFPAAWDPVPRTVVRRSRSSASRPTRAWSASARATRWTGSRPSSTCSSARTRWPSPATSASLETIDFHAGRYWPLEAALWDIVGQVAGLPGGDAVRRRHATGSRPTPRAGCCCRPAARAESALRLRDEGFRALKIRVDPRRLDDGLAAVARHARRRRRHDGDHGRPEPGLADGRRHEPVAGPGRRPARSRRRLAELDVLWVEEPLAGTDLRGPGRRCAGPASGSASPAAR